MFKVNKLSAKKVKEKCRARVPGRFGDGANLWLQVTPTGSCSWLFRDKSEQRDRVLGLGATRDVTLARARELAREFRTALAAGRDPWKERHPTTAILTFDDCAAEFLDNSKLPDRKKWESSLATYASPVIGGMPVNEITSDDILKILNPIWHEKPHTANRVRGRVERVLEFATHVKKQRSGSNPAQWKGVLAITLPSHRQIKPVTNRAAMPYGELPAFMETLKQRKRDDIAAQALRFVILTACRTGDVIGKASEAKPPMLWSHVDLVDKREWTIPNTKTGKPHTVPLCNATISLLRDLQSLGLDNSIVFPSLERPGKVIGKNAMFFLLKDLAPEVTVHGFRATFKTWADEVTNVERDVVETALAHKTVGDDSERPYRRGGFLAKRRQLMTMWSEYANGDDVAKVVTFGDGAATRAAR